MSLPLDPLTIQLAPLRDSLECLGACSVSFFVLSGIFSPWLRLVATKVYYLIPF